MNNLHELTKQLDVLTWNARSVLNALIRSAMSAGSSKGFTVTRAGDRLILDKDDIYRIYHFYEAWEAAGFPKDPEAFNELLAEENACYGDGEPVTEALVKHAKTVWMDSTNKGSSTDEWLSRIYNVENPKWFTNTAPIPLNIRTPIYDENLSTKTYDSYETYLFPSGYYSIDTLGYIGDGTTHTAGGKNWTFDVTDVFRVSSDRALFGIQDNDKIAVRESLYNPYKLKYAFEGGTNCFAYDKNSFSYGYNNQSNGERSAILGGGSNITCAPGSAIIGGTGNAIAGHYSVIAGGVGNDIGSTTNGFTANTYNNLGGYSYRFSRKITGSSTETQCSPTYSPEGSNCIYTLATIGSAGSPQSTVLGLNQIYITAETVDQSGMSSDVISYGYDTPKTGVFDFKVNDSVYIYALTVENSETKACKVVSAHVTNIEKYTDKGIVAFSDPATAIGYVVTIDKDFTVNTFTDLGNSTIRYGVICRASSSDYPLVLSNGMYLRSFELDSSNCAALGYNNVAAGRSQVVVGASNTELLRPNFIVGSGSSYIGAEDYHRNNSFVSGPHYTYSRASHYIVSGVSTYTTAYIHGDDGWSDNRRYDEDFNLDNVEKYEGFYAYCQTATSENEGCAVLRVYDQKSTLAIGWNGLVLYQPLLSDRANQSRTVWNELYCQEGSIGIHSGHNLDLKSAQTEDNNWLDFYNNYVRVSSTPGEDHTVTVWAKDKAGVHGKHLMLHASEHSGYIDIKSMALRIRSNTREALTAQPTEHNIDPFTQMSKRVDLIKDTGHVYTDKVGSGLSMADIDLGDAMTNAFSSAFHVFSSSKLLSYDSSTSKGTYDVAQLLLPGNLSPSCTRAIRGTKSMPHPIVIANKVIATDRGEGNNSREANSAYLYEELAYRSDINAVTAQIIDNDASPAYGIYVPKSRLDPNPSVTVPGATYAHVSDSFLASLENTSNKYHETATTVQVTSGTSHTGKLIRPTSFSGSVDRQTVVGDIVNAPEIFLDGVALNPGFNMVRVNDSQKTVGISYLAFAPRALAFDSISTIYTTNLAASSPVRSLYTSKFSSGSTTLPVNDLCDVWAVSVDGNTATWKKLLKNFLVTYAAGRLTVEFTISGTALNSGKFMPLKSASSGNGAVVDDSADQVLFRGTASQSQVLTIPLDAAIAHSLNTLINPTTQVFAQLHGRAYYTGNQNVSVTGQFAQQIPSLRYDRTLAGNLNETLYGPYLTINMAGWTPASGSWDLANKEFYVCLEGAVQYVN